MNRPQEIRKKTLEEQKRLQEVNCEHTVHTIRDGDSRSNLALKGKPGRRFLWFVPMGEIPYF